VVVELGVVVLDALEKEIAGLLEEWIDGEIERVEVGREGWEGRVGVLAKC